MTSDMNKIDRCLRSGRPITLEDKVMVYQHMSRVWRRNLDPQEIVAMTYIVDRSIGWGNAYYVASHKNVLHGSDQYAGIGLPERTYYEVLKRLEAKGLIFRKSRRDRTQIAVNLLWREEDAAPAQVFASAGPGNVIRMRAGVS